jgi:hypothetical protein
VINSFDTEVRATRTVYYPSDVPDEVRERIEWAYGSIGRIIRHPPSRVAWYPKAKEKRSTAWWTTLAKHPSVDHHEWRREHTENYWVYAVPQE